MLGERIRRLLLEEGGATSIEYALIAGFISIVVVGAVALIGQAVAGFFQAVLVAF